MLAAYHGHADLVRLLIQHGADPNRLNDRGQSPLAGAVFKKEDAVIEVGPSAAAPSPPAMLTPRNGLRSCSRPAQTPNTAAPAPWSA